MDSAALAESKLELQEERAAQGLSNEPTPSFEVDEVDDWEVRARGVGGGGKRKFVSACLTPCGPRFV